MVWYSTRERVARAIDAHDTTAGHDQIDDALESASRTVEGPDVCNRVFYPTTATRVFDWPPDDEPFDTTILWLGDDELLSVTTFTNGDAATLVEGTDFTLEPANTAGPYDSVEILRSSSSGFESADATHQQSLSIAGVFGGWPVTTTAAGALAAAISDTTGTTITVTNGHAVGVGDLLLIDSERLEVTGRALADSGETLGSNIDGEVSTVTVPVSDGTAFTSGEEITIDSETMLISSISGNNLTVRRRAAGTAVASHTSGTAVYASRSLTVTRGATGSTAATHSNSTVVYRHTWPGPVRAAVDALAIDEILQERAGYARTAGSGESERQVSGRGVAAKVAAARRSHGRKGRLF